MVRRAWENLSLKQLLEALAGPVLPPAAQLVGGHPRSGHLPGAHRAAHQGRPCLRCNAAHAQRCDHALTGTPLARLRKRGHWLPYLQSMLDWRSAPPHRDAPQHQFSLALPRRSNPRFSYRTRTGQCNTTGRLPGRLAAQARFTGLRWCHDLPPLRAGSPGAPRVRQPARRPACAARSTSRT